MRQFEVKNFNFEVPFKVKKIFRNAFCEQWASRFSGDHDMWPQNWPQRFGRIPILTNLIHNSAVWLVTYNKNITGQLSQTFRHLNMSAAWESRTTCLQEFSNIISTLYIHCSDRPQGANLRGETNLKYVECIKINRKNIQEIYLLYKCFLKDIRGVCSLELCFIYTLSGTCNVILQA